MTHDSEETTVLVTTRILLRVSEQLVLLVIVLSIVTSPLLVNHWHARSLPIN